MSIPIETVKEWLAEFSIIDKSQSGSMKNCVDLFIKNKLTEHDTENNDNSEEDKEARVEYLFRLVRDGDMYIYEGTEKILELFNYNDESSRGSCCKCGESCDYC